MEKRTSWRKYLKNVFMCTLFLLLAFAFNPAMKVSADTSTTMTFEKGYSGVAVSNQYDKYYFTCTQPGKVTINLNIPEGRVRWSLLDSNYVELKNSGDYSTKSYATGSNRYVVDLAAGTYEVDIISDFYETSDYTLSVEYSSAGETYTQANDMYIDVEQGNGIPFSGKITGQFALNDEHDYYKMVIPYKGTLNFSLINEMERSSMEICNSNGVALEGKVLFEKGAKTYSCTLEPGTYYLQFNRIKVVGKDNFTGKYYFTVNYELEVPKNITVKRTSSTAMKITAKKNGKITGYQIRYRKGSGSWKKVETKGNANLSKSITGLVPATYKVQLRLYYTASGKTSYSAWSDTKTVNCKVKTPTNIKIKSSAAGKMTVTAKKSEKITGYQIRYKTGSASWKTNTVKGNKNLNTTIKNLKKGSTYKVQIRAYYKVAGKNYYSDWSTVKNIRIKK